MPTPLSRLNIFRITILTLLLLSSVYACASGAYPEPDDRFVNDYASVLTSEDNQNIRSLFTALHHTSGIEAMVVTINSIADYGTGDTTIESFATNLFNTWGIGDSEKNDGALLLVALKDRTMRIELGSAYGHRRDTAMKVVIEEYMVPSFQRGDYSRGIYKGAWGLIERLTGTAPKDLTSPATRIKEWFLMSWFTLRTLHPAIWAIAAAIGALLVTACYWLFQQDRKGRCPTCHSRMVRLDEVADDAHLEQGQQLEETLASVNYDVWYCATCEVYQIRRHHQRSSYSLCPKCQYRTLTGRFFTIERATKYSAGKGRSHHMCRHCGYKEERFHTIPKIQETQDSSSSSSFSSRSSSSHSSKHGSSSRRSSSGRRSPGGGRSSGGGASGSW